MHGIALSQIMSTRERRMVALMSGKKSVEMIKEATDEDDGPHGFSFNRFEHLSFKEKLQLSLFKVLKRQHAAMEARSLKDLGKQRTGLITA